MTEKPDLSGFFVMWLLTLYITEKPEKDRNFTGKQPE